MTNLQECLWSLPPLLRSSFPPASEFFLLRSSSPLHKSATAVERQKRGEMPFSPLWLIYSTAGIPPVIPAPPRHSRPTSFQTPYVIPGTPHHPWPSSFQAPYVIPHLMRNPLSIPSSDLGTTSHPVRHPTLDLGTTSRPSSQAPIWDLLFQKKFATSKKCRTFAILFKGA